jgi:uncharacterized membrane protein YhdT
MPTNPDQKMTLQGGIEVPAWVGLALMVCPIMFWGLVGWSAYRLVRRIANA